MERHTYIRFIATCAFCLGLLLTNPANAQQIAELTGGGVNLTVGESSTGLGVTVSAPNITPGNTKVFALENPARLVIDLPKVSIKGDKERAVDHSAVHALRIGVHPDKTRIVIDLSGEKKPSFSVNAGKGKVSVAFEVSGYTTTNLASKTEKKAEAKDTKVTSEPAAAEEVASKKEEKPAPVVDDDFDDSQMEPAFEEKPATKTEEKSEKAAPKAPVILAKGAATAAKSENKEDPAAREEALLKADHARVSEKSKAGSKTEELETIEPEEQKAVSKEEELASDLTAGETEDAASGTKVAKGEAPTNPASTGGGKAAGSIEVTGIYYKSINAGKDAAVVISSDALKDYSLTSPNSGLYELLISKAHLSGPYLGLPQFPPDTFEGLEMVTAEQSGENVIIRIYVDDDAKLSPFRAKGQLWVKVQK